MKPTKGRSSLGTHSQTVMEPDIHASHLFPLKLLRTAAIGTPELGTHFKDYKLRGLQETCTW